MAMKIEEIEARYGKWEADLERASRRVDRWGGTCFMSMAMAVALLILGSNLAGVGVRDQVVYGLVGIAIVACLALAAVARRKAESARVARTAVRREQRQPWAIDMDAYPGKK